MYRRTSRIASAAFAALALGAPAAAQELYLVTLDDTLVRIDGPTGQVLEETPILGASGLQRGLALRWDGMLFMTDHNNGSERLFRIDPKTGQGEAIGAALPIGIAALAADPNTGRLYGTNFQNELYQIDHKTGAATLIGKMDAPELHWPVLSMAVGRDGFGYVSNMYEIVLFRVDLATAETTFVCQLGSQNWYADLAFDEVGLLWTVREWDGGMRTADIATCDVNPLYDDWYILGLEVVPSGSDCYPDCDADNQLDFFDLLCFQNAFNAGDPRAECTGDNVLDFFDFLCFLNSFDAGC
jgi:hypothetical protein